MKETPLYRVGEIVYMEEDFGFIMKDGKRMKDVPGVIMEDLGYDDEVRDHTYLVLFRSAEESYYLTMPEKRIYTHA